VRRRGPISAVPFHANAAPRHRPCVNMAPTAQSPAQTYSRCNDSDAVALCATMRLGINHYVLTGRIIPSDRV
jgi:hypothetical protein